MRTLSVDEWNSLIWIFSELHRLLRPQSIAEDRVKMTKQGLVCEVWREP